MLGQGLAAPFVLRFIGPQAQTESSVGLTLAGIKPLSDPMPAPSWLVLVGAPGSSMALDLEPACHLPRNRVFVTDGPIHRSAGVPTGIDLILHRIGGVSGTGLAAQVAQSMVLALRRGPEDPELSPFLACRHHLHPASPGLAPVCSGRHASAQRCFATKNLAQEAHAVWTWASFCYKLTLPPSFWSAQCR